MNTNQDKLTRRRWSIGGVTLAITVVVVGVGGHFATASHADSGTVPFSNVGTSTGVPPFSKVDQRFLGGNPASARILGSHRGLTFYASTGSGGTTCYSTGATPTSAGAGVTDSLGCPSDFPSASKPVLDDSFVAEDPSTGAITVLRLTGFAADSVTSVAVIGTDGSTTSAPVRNNLYDLAGLSVPARAISAFNAAGHVVYTIPLASAK